MTVASRGLMALLSLVFGMRLAAAQTVGPSIYLPQPRSNFGVVSEGTTVERTFPIKNSGTEPLMLTRLVSSCGCVVVDQNGVVIPPGETYPLKVAFKTQGFEGARERVIRIFSNDPENAITTLTLLGEIKPLVEVVPEVVRLPNVVSYGSTEKSRTTQIEVKKGVISEDEWKGIKAVSLSPDIEIRELQRTASVYRFQTILSEEAPLGTLRSRIILKSEKSKGFSRNVPVYAKISSPLSFSPRLLRVTLKDGKKIRREVSLKNQSSKPIKVLAANTKYSFIRPSVSEIRPGREYKVSLEIDGSEIQESIRDAVLLVAEPEIPNLPVLEVHVTVPPSIE